LGVGLSPFEQLEIKDWSWAKKAAVLSFLRCGRVVDPESLDVAAALLLHVADASEKQETGEKSEIRNGLTQDEARVLLLRIYRGQQLRFDRDFLGSSLSRG
jgi:hypothetical protein